jgi:hypothetical protein
VARHLVEHVLEEGHAGGELRLAAAVEVEADGDFRLQGLARDFGLPHGGRYSNE